VLQPIVPPKTPYTQAVEQTFSKLPVQVWPSFDNRWHPTNNFYIHTMEGQRTGRKTQFLEGAPLAPGVGSILPQKQAILNRPWDSAAYQYNAPVRIAILEDMPDQSDEESSEKEEYVSLIALFIVDNVHYSGSDSGDESDDGKQSLNNFIDQQTTR
jgi:hypothetical protein